MMVLLIRVWMMLPTERASSFCTGRPPPWPPPPPLTPLPTASAPLSAHQAASLFHLVERKSNNFRSKSIVFFSILWNKIAIMICQLHAMPLWKLLRNSSYYFFYFLLCEKSIWVLFLYLLNFKLCVITFEHLSSQCQWLLFLSLHLWPTLIYNIVKMLAWFTRPSWNIEWCKKMIMIWWSLGIKSVCQQLYISKH